MNFKNYSLTINFNDIGEIKEFVDDIDQVEISKLKKFIKKTSGSADKRGGKTKNLHAKAKEYQSNNPTITYKEALKSVGKQIREENKKDKQEVLSNTEELIKEL